MLEKADMTLRELVDIMNHGVSSDSGEFLLRWPLLLTA